MDIKLKPSIFINQRDSTSMCLSSF